ncbi:MAG TPA: hypothetical protein DDW45_05005 [Gammaproteobacteria bacterium]|nr:hypothetical protein [Gammaproteobacteria bacterium]
MQKDDNRSHIIHDSRKVGSGAYASAEAALRDLVSGNLPLPSSGVSAAMLGIPDSLREWGFVLGGNT